MKRGSWIAAAAVLISLLARAAPASADTLYLNTFTTRPWPKAAQTLRLGYGEKLGYLSAPAPGSVVVWHKPDERIVAAIVKAGGSVSYDPLKRGWRISGLLWKTSSVFILDRWGCPRTAWGCGNPATAYMTKKPPVAIKPPPAKPPKKACKYKPGPVYGEKPKPEPECKQEKPACPPPKEREQIRLAKTSTGEVGQAQEALVSNTSGGAGFVLTPRNRITINNNIKVVPKKGGGDGDGDGDGDGKPPGQAPPSNPNVPDPDPTGWTPGEAPEPGGPPQPPDADPNGGGPGPPPP